MLNPRVHIICGMCGNKTMMTFRIGKDIDDDTNKEYHYVRLFCGNCSSLTDLSEIIKEENKL